MEIGSIISYKNNDYLIIDDEDNYGCLKIIVGLDKKLNLKDHILVDYLKYISIDKTDNMIFIDTISREELLCILSTYRTRLKFYKDKPVLQRGSLVIDRKSNKLYYIYGENSDNWLTFEVKNLPHNNYDELKIGNRCYYANYYNVNINKNYNLNYIDLATSEEIETIKYNKKRFVGRRKKINDLEKRKLKMINFGAIVNNNDLDYLVISKKGKKICCIRKDCMEDINPKLHYFDTDEVKLVDHSTSMECKKMIKRLGFLYRSSKVIK